MKAQPWSCPNTVLGSEWNQSQEKKIKTTNEIHENDIKERAADQSAPRLVAVAPLFWKS